MIKYSLGLDVSKNDFHCCISVLEKDQRVVVKSSRKFPNNKEGFSALNPWIQKHHKDKATPLVITMEATGIYYEMIALYLYKEGYRISVVLPNKAKKYLQSTGIKSKNDKIDAQGLSRMGAEQRLEPWQPMEDYFYRLRLLTRQHQSLQELKTSIGNQLHAAEYSMYPDQIITDQLNTLLATLKSQLKELEKAIASHLQNNVEVSEKVENICQVKGVGLLTVAVILAETNGFTLFTGARQLVSYAGYDVVENQSGGHRGKTRISKKGNSRIRRILHMPAFVAVSRSGEKGPIYQLYQKTFARHGLKMKSYVAVQKKLLVLIYSLWKSGKVYDPDYGSKRHAGDNEQEPSSLPGPQAGMHAQDTQNESSATGALHKVDSLSINSQFASSLQPQN